MFGGSCSAVRLFEMLQFGQDRVGVAFRRISGTPALAFEGDLDRLAFLPLSREDALQLQHVAGVDQQQVLHAPGDLLIELGQTQLRIQGREINCLLAAGRVYKAGNLQRLAIRPNTLLASRNANSCACMARPSYHGELPEEPPESKANPTTYYHTP